MEEEQTRWRVVQSEAGPEYRIFRVRVDWAVSPRTGKEGRYVVLECPTWANVIALTGEEQVVLVRQYRHGIQEETLEIPAGLVEPGEDPMAAAQRELLEETGYGGGQWTMVGRVRPNPAFLDNWCYTFLAEDVQLLEPPRLDEGEAILVELSPLGAIPDLIRSGAIDQAIVLSAFYQLENWKAAQF